MFRFRVKSLCLFLCLIFTACSKPYTHEISGMVLEDTRDELLNIDVSRISIDISSPGGKAGPSIQIAEFLIKKDVNLNVKNICNSACSQLILPVADIINFIDSPLVGFHNSLMLDVEYFIQNGGDLSKCPSLQDLRDRESEVLSHNNLNQNFWKEVDKRLLVKNFKLIKYKGDDCRGYDYEFEHFIWYPTSQQLRDLFGLNFKGSVCADDFVSCVKRIDSEVAKHVIIEDFSIVIGDEVYMSKGKG